MVVEKISNQGGRKKVGLALGGGGAKGLAHIGVIKVLERAEIPINFIAGTSMGALVGGWYALTGNIYAIEKLFLELKNKKLLSSDKITAERDGHLFADKTIVEMLEAGFRRKHFKDCRIPFAAVTTDVATGEQRVLKKGNLTEAVRASIALPIAFRPVKTGGHLLMDGGFVDPVPADVVREMGADVVIASDVASRWINMPSEDLQDITRVKNLYSFIYELVAGVEYHITQRVLKDADVVLKVPVATLDWLEFDRVNEIIARGEAEAKRNIREIAKKTGCRTKIKKTGLEKFIEMVFK